MFCSLRPFLAGMFLLGVSATTFARADDDRWASFRFLIGSWVSEGSPTEGSGRFTLEPDLDGKILLRRNTAYVPTGPKGSKFKHEDLMVIYRDPSTKRFRASYFDSEGHTIQYSVSSLPDDKGLVFESDPDPSSPRFRLTYTKIEGGRVAISFDIALPGQKNLKTYLKSTVRREQPAK